MRTIITIDLQHLGKFNVILISVCRHVTTQVEFIIKHQSMTISLPLNLSQIMLKFIPIKGGNCFNTNCVVPRKAETNRNVD